MGLAGDLSEGIESTGVTQPEIVRIQPITDEQDYTLPAVVPGKLRHFLVQNGVRCGSRMGAAGRCFLHSLSQGFQGSSFGVLPVFVSAHGE